jgi:hypothetical protein
MLPQRSAGRHMAPHGTSWQVFGAHCHFPAGSHKITTPKPADPGPAAPTARRDRGAGPATRGRLGPADRTTTRCGPPAHDPPINRMLQVRNFVNAMRAFFGLVAAQVLGRPGERISHKSPPGRHCAGPPSGVDRPTASGGRPPVRSSCRSGPSPEETGARPRDMGRRPGRSSGLAGEFRAPVLGRATECA